MGGEAGVAYGQCEKPDQAAAISIGHHAAVRPVVSTLPLFHLERGIPIWSLSPSAAGGDAGLMEAMRRDCADSTRRRRCLSC
jgi:hypothetical protein